MHIREAKAEDVPACVEMIEARRLQYQGYEPAFWKKADDSAETTGPFFEMLFGKEENVCLAAEEAGKQVGFLIALPLRVPPVYDPGGPAATIDDFCVISEDRWADIGAALLAEARSRLRARGVSQVVVVCGHKDAAKSAMLRQTDMSLTTDWWTATA